MIHETYEYLNPATPPRPRYAATIPVSSMNGLAAREHALTDPRYHWAIPVEAREDLRQALAMWNLFGFLAAVQS